MKLYRVFHFCIYMTISQITNAQVIDWANYIENGVIRDGAEDQYGNQFYAGHTNGNPLIVSNILYNNNSSYETSIVVKFTPLKAIEWVKQIMNSGPNQITSISYRSGIGLWVTGYYKDSIHLDNFVFYSPGLNSCYLAKLDPTSGNIIWATSTSGQEAMGLKIHISANQDILLGIQYSGNIQFLNQGFTNTGNGDFCILRINPSQTIVGQAKITGLNNEHIYGLTTDQQGNILFCGITSSNQVMVNTTIYPQNFPNNLQPYPIIGKLDSLGNSLWLKIYNVPTGFIMDISVDRWNNTYFTGSHSQTAQYDNFIFTQPMYQFYLTLGKISGSGNTEWVKEFGHPSPVYSQQQYGLSIDIGPDDNIYLTGCIEDSIEFGSITAAMVSPFNVYPNQTGVLIVKFDTSGSAIWAKTSSGKFSYGEKIKILSPINMIVIGNYSDSIYLEQFLLKKYYPYNTNYSNYFYCNVKYNANEISGKLFIDSNSNGIADPGELPIPGKPISITNSSTTVYTNSQGRFKHHIFTGPTAINAPSAPTYFTISTSNPINYNYSNWGQKDTNAFFGYAPNGQYDDLEISYTTIGWMFGLGPHNYQIDYRNKGTTTQQVQIKFVMDTSMTFLNAQPYISNQSGDTLIWNLGLIPPFSNGTIIVNLVRYVIGMPWDPMFFEMEIFPNSNDATPMDNYLLDTNYLFTSFDPNYKTVSKSVISPQELSNSPWLNYTIHFQNIGNAPAKNIWIRDTFSVHLDLASLQMVSSSFPCEFSIDANREGVFKFNNIMLPDSTSDPIGSCGFVKYRVQPYTNVPSGTTIFNAADIYFDYNEPIRTDWATTYIPYSVSQSEDRLESTFKIYPNPVSGSEFIIELPYDYNTGILELYSPQATLILKLNLTENSTKNKIIVPVSTIKSGIYFGKLLINNNIHQFKIIINSE